jgi:transposase-like protein
MTAKTTATETPAATTDEGRAKSAVSKDGDHKCPSCKDTKPVTKYPTKRNGDGEYVRDTSECRACRDARRVARKAEKEAAA